MKYDSGVRAFVPPTQMRFNTVDQTHTHTHTRTLAAYVNKLHVQQQQKKK